MEVVKARLSFARFSRKYFSRHGDRHKDEKRSPHRANKSFASEKSASAAKDDTIKAISRGKATAWLQYSLVMTFPPLCPGTL